MPEAVNAPWAPDQIDTSWWSAASAALGEAANLEKPELWFSELTAAAREAPKGSL